MTTTTKTPANGSIVWWMTVLPDYLEKAPETQHLSSDWKTGWNIRRGVGMGTTILYAGASSHRAEDFPTSDIFFGCLSSALQYQTPKTRRHKAAQIVNKLRKLGLIRETTVTVNPSSLPFPNPQHTQQITLIERK